jgi:outer membrane protein TolC
MLVHGGICTAQPVSLTEALRGALQNNTNVRLQEQQARFAHEVLNQASGAFDPALSGSIGATRDQVPTSEAQLAQSPLRLNALRTDSLRTALRFDQPLRNGMLYGASLSTERLAGTVSRLSDTPAQNLGRLDFHLLVPLGRGSGPAASANERAAEMEARAALNDLRHAVAVSLFSASRAYWSLVAAQKGVDIALQAEETMRRLRADIGRLVAADERPAADLVLLDASLAQRRLQLTSAEQSLQEARSVLGRVMGLPHAVIPLLQTASEFPPLPFGASGEVRLPAQLPELAMQRRADLEAAKLRTESARVLLEAAQRNVRPQLDLSFNAGLAALKETSSLAPGLFPFSRNQTGPSASVNLTYQWPLHNRAARAVLEQRLALLAQSDIRAADLRDAIGTGIENAGSAVVRAARQTRDSSAAVELYTRSVANERIKNRLGQATLVDILTVNDQLLSSLSSQVTYQANLLTALAQLRFETGTLLEPSGDRQALPVDRLLTLPDAMTD